jgi:hypothetical protein
MIKENQIGLDGAGAASTGLGQAVLGVARSTLVKTKRRDMVNLMYFRLSTRASIFSLDKAIIASIVS